MTTIPGSLDGRPNIWERLRAASMDFMTLNEEDRVEKTDEINKNGMHWLA